MKHSSALSFILICQSTLPTNYSPVGKFQKRPRKFHPLGGSKNLYLFQSIYLGSWKPAMVLKKYGTWYNRLYFVQILLKCM